MTPTKLDLYVRLVLESVGVAVWLLYTGTMVDRQFGRLNLLGHLIYVVLFVAGIAGAAWSARRVRTVWAERPATQSQP